MVSGEQKRFALREKLQLLRAVTNSEALGKTSIIADATKHIQELQKKVNACAQDLPEENPLSMVTVETLEKGFLITVVSEKNCHGLLLSILEAFEDLDLDVLDASVSCTASFSLKAVGERLDESVDAKAVRQAVMQAINSCTENKEQE